MASNVYSKRLDNRRKQAEKRRLAWAEKQNAVSAKRRLSKLPLRVSLIIVVMVISGCGMVVTGGVVTSVLAGFMQSRVDASLESTAHSPYIEQGKLPAQNAYSNDPRLPSQYFVQVTHDNGSVVTYGYGFESVPNLDKIVGPTKPVTVDAARGSRSPAHWRATAVLTADNDLVVVAVSMEDQERTINRLLLLQIGIGCVVLALLFIVSWWIIHRSLRPLAYVEETAGKIADGDLTQRLPPWPQNTEVGHLASSLNKMLAQIEQSFDNVELSEAQAQANAKAALKAEAQAREAEKTMRRFIGDASHELRTPLTSVRGYAELYRSGATDDANFVLDKISDEAGRMSLLVEDLLSLARMDDSRPLEKKSVDMLSLVIGVVQGMKASFPDRDISMSNKCELPPIVTGDSSRLHQVLANLTTNALKHAGPDAVVKLTLSDAVMNSDGCMIPAVKVTVEDNGVGIAQEDCDHIFERFYRADSSRSRHQGGGSGLGLSIAKGLVEAHGGTISVSSALGEGTTFTVLLPHE